ncbi:hypothetical protein D3C87_1214830 [compost metagenome]
MSKEAASLDDRIADAFAGEQTSQTIAALLQEVQQTSADAEATSKAAEQRALNPRLRPADVDAARKEMEDANFRSKRMDAAAEQLSELLHAAKSKEAAAARAAEYEAAKEERDQLVKDLAAYEKHASAIVQLLDRLAKNTERLQRTNAGQNADSWLYSAQKIARGAASEIGIQYDAQLPNLIDGVRLPNFRKNQNSTHGFMWPPIGY